MIMPIGISCFWYSENWTLGGSKWVEWCISKAKFSVLVDGSPTISLPQSLRGLRQGDHFSPYLFCGPHEGFSFSSRERKVAWWKMRVGVLVAFRSLIYYLLVVYWCLMRHCKTTWLFWDFLYGWRLVLVWEPT